MSAAAWNRRVKPLQRRFWPWGRWWFSRQAVEDRAKLAYRRGCADGFDAGKRQAKLEETDVISSIAAEVRASKDPERTIEFIRVKLGELGREL